MTLREDHESSTQTPRETAPEPTPPSIPLTGAMLAGLIVLTSIAWRVDSRLHSSLFKKPATALVRVGPTEVAKEPLIEDLPRPEQKAEEPPVVPEERFAPEEMKPPVAEGAPLTEADRYFLQATSDYEAKDYKAAAEALRQGLALEPDNTVQQAMFAMVLSYQERWAESAEAYRKALKGQPNDALLHLGLGVALHRQERPQEAVKSMERAVALNPEMKEAQRMLEFLTREPEGTLEKVWFEHNVQIKEWEGFWIHAACTANFWNKRQGVLRVAFFHEDGRPVYGIFSNFVLASGQAVIEGHFTPPHRKTRYKDLHLFFPYKGLRLAEGDHRLKAQLELEGPTGEVLATQWASIMLEVLETAYNGAVEEARSSSVP